MTSKLQASLDRHPPRAPLNTLANIVADWHFRYGVNGVEKLQRDTVVDVCKRSRDLEEAIGSACASKRTNGKLHNHQSRVPWAIREHFADLIKARLTKEPPRDFDHLIGMLERIRPAGIGDVTTYDVATRIGGYLNLEPTTVYLHADVAYGYCQLMKYGKGRKPPAKVARDSLPPPLNELPADEAEDFLCSYSELLGAVGIAR